MHKVWSFWHITTTATTTTKTVLCSTDDFNKSNFRRETEKLWLGISLCNLTSKLYMRIHTSVCRCECMWKWWDIMFWSNALRCGWGWDKNQQHEKMKKEREREFLSWWDDFDIKGLWNEKRMNYKKNVHELGYYIIVSGIHSIYNWLSALSILYKNLIFLFFPLLSSFVTFISYFFY